MDEAKPVRPIQGMQSVIATVSGYHGSERFNLIKAIDRAGASYVGALSSSTTHLICWKYEGRKYEFAKKFNIQIVNHRWIEDCLKQGKRVPEGPYMLQSGQEVGLVQLQIPMDAEACNQTKKHKVLSDKTNFSIESSWPASISGFRDYEDDGWTASSLLKQCEDFPSSSTKPRREKNIVIVDDELDNPSNLHARMENITSYGSRHSPLAESSHRKRRLVKKGSNRESKSVSLDTDHEPFPIKDAGNPSEYLKGSTNVRKPETGGTLDSLISGQQSQRLINIVNEEPDEVEDWNEHLSSEDLSIKNSIIPLKLAPQDEPDTMISKEEIEERPLAGQAERLPSSVDLSCVICWTDFSSTRGILPCGHRFCYSCIRNWADHMVSRRKTSTCPLCKTSFLSITKVEDAACADQKIYSQTVPHALSSIDVYLIADHEALSPRDQLSGPPACSVCSCREPEDLLIRCHLCQIRCIHRYCLDPPLLPWTCIHCKDLQMLYYRSR